MKQLNRFLVIISVIMFIALLAITYFNYYLKPQKHVITDSTVIMEKINNVLKLVTIEGQFSEIHKHTEYYGYDIAPFRKKALVRVNANVLVGYDLEKINMQIDEKNREIMIEEIPSPEFLSIAQDVEYYDVSEGLFTSFSPDDYNAIQKIAKNKIIEAARESKLLTKAEKQKDEMLDMLKLTLNSVGWELYIKEKYKFQEQLNQD